MGEDLDEVILRCLEKDPEARWQSATALREALEACDCAHGWSQRQARAWWSENEGVEAVAPEETGSSHSLAVDFEARS